MSRAAQAVAQYVREHRVKPGHPAARSRSMSDETNDAAATQAQEIEPETSVSATDQGETAMATKKTNGKKEKTPKAPKEPKAPKTPKAAKTADAAGAEKKAAGAKKGKRAPKPQPEGKIKSVEPKSGSYLLFKFEGGPNVQCRTSHTYRDTLVKALKAQL